ncbi:hypothetical protein QQF64_017943 [Cirrhinus molitorella]|uniref:Uncharacterized protein n=1 Tax=Cirrhinus molitorella TaxID=172907 RepID=A0ABR3LK20_9TELE
MGCVYECSGFTFESLRPAAGDGSVIASSVTPSPYSVSGAPLSSVTQAPPILACHHGNRDTSQYRFLEEDSAPPTHHHSKIT